MKKDVSMQANLEMNHKDGIVTVSINPKIYPLDVVFSAGYVFTEKNYVLIDGDPEEEIVVELKPKGKEDIEKLGRNFNNELVNYASYAVQTMKNQRLRESILNRVLLTYSEGQDCVEPASEESCEEIATPWEEEGSWLDDPEGIAVPWEEKYGKDKS